MTDDSHRRRPLLLAAAAAALLLAGGGFYAGRATAPQPSAPGAGGCSDARSALQNLVGLDPESADPGTAKQAFTIVLQNPSCFDAATRAKAQTALDNSKLHDEACATADPVTRVSLGC